MRLLFGEVDLVGLKPDPWDRYFLQCFDTVGWVIWHVKTGPDMTYDVFSGTLNPAQSVILYIRLDSTLLCPRSPVARPLGRHVQ